MAADTTPAARLRAALTGTPDIVEKRMFGGACFLRGGHLVCGIQKDRFMLRVGTDSMTNALAQLHTHPFEMSGRPTKGFVLVDAAVSDAALAEWVAQSLAFVATLPAK